MPFTIAHAAAAPPLWRLSRRHLVLSALVVGSMAPDFEYFVHLGTVRTIGHTVPGLFLMCLPASLVVLVVWHRLLELPLARLVPVRASALVTAAERPFPFLPLSRLTAICASVLAGAVSHVVWDSFTHHDGWAVRYLGLWRPVPGFGGRPAFQVLQYACGVLGMVVLGLLAVGWLRRHPEVRPERLAPARTRMAVAAGVVATSVLGAGANVARLAPHAQLRIVLTAAAIGAIVGALVTMTGYGVVAAARDGGAAKTGT